MRPETIDDWLEKHSEQMIDLQAGLTARPALGPENGGAGEWEKARYLEQYLRSHGLEQIEHYDCPDDRVPEGSRPNMVVTVPGLEPEPRLWVLAHMDVVPPGEQDADGTWKGGESDPYTLCRAGDLPMGRGVSDDQQAIVGSVFAARALLESGSKPARTLKLLFVSDEETGSERGLRHLLKEHADMFSRRDAILVPDGSSEDSSMIEVAEKSVLWMQFRVIGRQAHGSRPDRAVNAFRAASSLVQLLDEGLHARFDRVDHLFEPPRSTFEPTLHAANVPNVNSIPGEDLFCFDCRVLPSYSLDEVIEFARSKCAQIDRQFGTRTELTVRTRQDAPPATPVDAPVVRMLRPAVEEVYGVKARIMGIGGLTVASPLREAGFHAAVWMSASGTAHQVNEVCSIRQMVGDAKVFARVYLSRS